MIGRTYEVSTQAWPQPLRAPAGGPNVLFIILDDTGFAPVTDDYSPPFPFTGTIERVVYDVSGEVIADHEAEIRKVLARQ